MFLATIGAEEAYLEASFCAAIRTGTERNSISLAARADGTYAEYRRKKTERVGRARVPTTSLLN